MSPNSTAALQELFTGHLRARLVLRDVLQAEREILVKIVEALAAIPAAKREALMRSCVADAAEALVYE